MNFTLKLGKKIKRKVKKKILSLPFMASFFFYSIIMHPKKSIILHISNYIHVSTIFCADIWHISAYSNNFVPASRIISPTKLKTVRDVFL